MGAAATPAAAALERGERGVLEFDRHVSDWIDPAFRRLLGDHAHWLQPPPEEAW
jgi:hypothetical protein